MRFNRCEQIRRQIYFKYFSLELIETQCVVVFLNFNFFFLFHYLVAVKCLFQFVSLHTPPIESICITLSILVAERERESKKIARTEHLFKCEFPLWLIWSHSCFFYTLIVFAGGCKWVLLPTHNALYCSLSSLPLICKALVPIKCRETEKTV